MGLGLWREVHYLYEVDLESGGRDKKIYYINN
jgi:hypothetical protein